MRFYLYGPPGQAGQAQQTPLRTVLLGGSGDRRTHITAQHSALSSCSTAELYLTELKLQILLQYKTLI